MANKIMNFMQLFGGELFFYTYQPFLAVAPGATPQQAINIDGDFDFAMSNIFGYALVSGSATKDVRFSLNLKDSNTSKDYFSSPTFSALVCSNAESLNPLPTYRIIQRKASVSLTVSNISGGNLDIYITLRGYKIYNRERMQRYAREFGYSMGEEGKK
jgi:hypothetical protein